MEVILLQDVKSIGKKNQTVKVSDGYARNYLFPKKLAVEATAVNKNIVNMQNAAAAKKHAEEEAAAKKQKAELEKISLTIKAKGSEAKLFGAITSKEVADELEKTHGVTVDKKKINLSAAIKTYGEYTADIRLYPEISAKIAIHVIPE